VIDLGDTTSWTMHCPCYIVRDEFNPKLTLGGVPGDLATLHMFENSIDLVRNYNAGFFCCHDEIGRDSNLLGAIWGPNYNQIGGTFAHPYVRHDQADPYRLPNIYSGDGTVSSPCCYLSPANAPPYIGSSPTVGKTNDEREDFED
jgi:hypothetical protein